MSAPDLTPVAPAARSDHGRRTAQRIALLASDSRAEADGIRDYSSRLLDTLRALPAVEAQLFLRPQHALKTEVSATGSHAWSLDAATSIIVQYNPFWYARWGFAPGLPITLRNVRRAAPGAKVALMVHENYIDAKNVKWALMSAWQRIQLRALQRQADVQFCTIEAWTELLRRSRPTVPAHHLPVGSNFDDRRGNRDESRTSLGVSDTTLVVTTFGLGHPGRLTRTMIDAAHAASERVEQVVLLNLGTGAAERTRLSPSLTLVSTGFLTAEATARTLAASDVYLAAFEDGVSTRRGTLMAALQHEVAVVGTSGTLTDDLLKRETAALQLVPASEPRAFAAAVAELAEDTVRRTKLARAGRGLYSRCFDWPVITEHMLSLIDGSA